MGIKSFYAVKSYPIPLDGAAQAYARVQLSRCAPGAPGNLTLGDRINCDAPTKSAGNDHGRHRFVEHSRPQARPGNTGLLDRPVYFSRDCLGIKSPTMITMQRYEQCFGFAPPREARLLLTPTTFMAAFRSDAGRVSYLCTLLELGSSRLTVSTRSGLKCDGAVRKDWHGHCLIVATVDLFIFASWLKRHLPRTRDPIWQRFAFQERPRLAQSGRR
jgi:hypothetical protein